MLYPTVCNVDELEPKILQGKQPPKTDENETATKIDPAPCHILKCPNLSIYQVEQLRQIISANVVLFRRKNIEQLKKFIIHFRYRLHN